MENKYISETELEKKLISKLKIEGYEYIKLNNEEDIKTNFRNQIFNHGVLYDEPAKNNSCEIVFLFLY